jgi:hypothetical protein
MIAPPNHGSRLAKLRLALEFAEGFNLIRREDARFSEAMVSLIRDGLGAAGRDLRPGSLFLERLAAEELPPGTEAAVIAGTAGLVTPEGLEQLIEWITEREQEADSPYARMIFSRLKNDLNGMDEIVHGRGDLAVSLDSARLEGMPFFTVPRNHINICSAEGDNPVFSRIRTFFELEP